MVQLAEKLVGRERMLVLTGILAMRQMVFIIVNINPII